MVGISCTVNILKWNVIENIDQIEIVIKKTVEVTETQKEIGLAGEVEIEIKITRETNLPKPIETTDIPETLEEKINNRALVDIPQSKILYRYVIYYQNAIFRVLSTVTNILKNKLLFSIVFHSYQTVLLRMVE